jgi:hypothetical protein
MWASNSVLQPQLAAVVSEGVYQHCTHKSNNFDDWDLTSATVLPIKGNCPSDSDILNTINPPSHQPLNTTHKSSLHSENDSS